MSTAFLFLWMFSCCCLIAEPTPIRTAQKALVKELTVTEDARVHEFTVIEDEALHEHLVNTRAVDKELDDRSQQLAAKSTQQQDEGKVEVRKKRDTPIEPHEVQHIDMLKNERFWILMGVVIICIAGVVIKVEVGSAATATPRETEPSESEEDEFSRKYYLHMALTISALYAAMLLWGVAQEYVMSHPYISSDGLFEFMPSSLSLVFWNRIIAVLFLGGILKISGKPLYFEGFRMGSLPALTNSLASWCQYDSLKYITFALQVTVKSTKLLPVVLISSFRGKRNTVFDYMEALLLMMALVVFGVETEGTDDSVMLDGKLHGILLLVGLVLFDAVTPHLQDMFFKSYRDLDSMSAQFSMSSFAAIGILVVQLCTGTLFTMAGFVHRHPDCLLHMTVLGMSSALTQYLITYTIKNYGPVSFTVITSVRQVVAVFVSDTLFGHNISGLAMVAMAIVFSTIVFRAVRQISKSAGRQSLEDDRRLLGMQRQDANPVSERLQTILAQLANADGYSSLLTCAISLHVCFCFYAIAQEFLATHSFDGGNIFAFPMFLVAGNHSVAFLFAAMALKAQNVPIISKHLHWTSIPASTNLVGTYLQHAALYQIFFPAQTLLKSLKIIPVMAVGRLLKNRSYTILDYVEAFVITALVAFFVYDFELSPALASDQEAHKMGSGETEQDLHVYLGIAMMLGYVVMDATTVNTEDVIYQQYKLDPGQMLVGMEAISGVLAWLTMAGSGECTAAFQFMHFHGNILLFASLIGLAMASAVGAYTCVLTVRLFGPAVLALLMLCRQILSLVASVVMFQHEVRWQSCLCLVVVCNLILLASIRRVAAQLTSHSDDESKTASSHKEAMGDLEHK